MNQDDLDALIGRHDHKFCEMAALATRDGCPLAEVVVMVIHPSSSRYASWRKQPLLSGQTVLGQDGLLAATTRQLAIQAADAEERAGLADNLRKIPAHGRISLLVFCADGTDDDCVAQTHLGVCHEDESTRGHA